MKKFFKFILWFTAVPWFLHLFKAAFSDIPRAVKMEGDDFIYIAAWVFTFPLMMGLTVIWAFFTSIRWIFIHPYFLRSDCFISPGPRDVKGSRNYRYSLGDQWLYGNVFRCFSCF